MRSCEVSKCPYWDPAEEECKLAEGDDETFFEFCPVFGEGKEEKGV